MWLRASKADSSIIEILDQEPLAKVGSYIVRCPALFTLTMWWQSSARGFTDLPVGYRWDAAKRTWIEDPALVEVQLLADVKAESERRKMLRLSNGGAKKTEYAEKRAEVLDWDTLGGTAAAILLAFDKLSTANRAIRFAHAVADAAAFGDTAPDAITRFRAGLARSAITAAISATEAKTCALIKMATTAAAKRAAANAVVWPN